MPKEHRLKRCGRKARLPLRSYTEIAAILGMSKQGVRKGDMRAISKIMKALSKDPDVRKLWEDGFEYRKSRCALMGWERSANKVEADDAYDNRM